MNEELKQGARTETKLVQTETKLVQMRLQPKTLQRLDRLSEITGTDNRTQLVAVSIQLAEDLFAAIRDGAKVYIERPNGTKEVIKVIGI